jgi:CRISPR-associated protein Csm1
LIKENEESKKEESKSLINRIKSSDIGFDKLQQNACNGKIDIPKVWRLKYYLKRNISEKNKAEVEKLFDEYTEAILNAFMKHQTSNPDLYPVAARWAELLMKKNNL